jgi:septum formation protein
LNKKFILASSSPRRKELLKLIVEDFDIVVSDVDENIDCSCPKQMVEVLAYRKAKATFDKLCGEHIVIGADTVVVLDDEIMGKPKDQAEAFDMLERLSSKQHSVYTGFCIFSNDMSIVSHEKTSVFFDNLDESSILEYIETGEPMDKAGSYGIQGYGSKFIKKIDGCYFCVMGLPVNRIYTELKKQQLI